MLDYERLKSNCDVRSRKYWSPCEEGKSIYFHRIKPQFYYCKRCGKVFSKKELEKFRNNG